ncbi:MAG: DeoR/GlpR transcriptional regulator [Clostridia bacterium]|nr:DeoR/GlpR transcriptional regulator [Clostridia bacterium]
MLKEERYDKILELLETNQYLSAQKLSKLLFVSLPTIRRDLAELQRRELIIRNHGGAKKYRDEHGVIPIDFRKTVNLKEKKDLCSVASSLINDGDVIFLDASTTILQMADFIEPKSTISIVTNSIPLSLLLHKKGIKTYCTGGELQQNSMCYAGSFAQDFITNFNFDKMFFSSRGVNDNGVITDTSLPETLLRKAVLKQTKESIFLCDSSKFSLSADYNLTELNNVSAIITNSKDIYSFVSSKFRGTIHQVK